MKKILTTLVLFSFVIIALGQQAKHYDFKVKFDIPQRRIDVEGTINFDLNNQDSIVFILWKNTNIKSITIDGKKANFSFDTIGELPYRYCDGGKLIIKNFVSNANIVPIHFVYTCNMENVSGWAKSYSEEWIELGLYTGWYPMYDISKSKNFTSLITVSIDSSFVVSGSGIVAKNGEDWTITHNWPIFDNVIIAAKDLKTKKFREDNIAIDLVYTIFPENDLDSVAVVCKEVYELFSNIFGQPGGDSYLKFVLSPNENGSGYGRSKFISIDGERLDQNLKDVIVHEIAHFWWYIADVATWEDWLNEGFATYSELLYLQEKGNKDYFLKTIERYRKWTVDSKPIWDIDRGDPGAPKSLYGKGAFILLEFEEIIGTKEMCKLLKMIVERKISNTADFLKLVETEYSNEYKNWFVNKLKT